MSGEPDPTEGLSTRRTAIRSFVFGPITCQRAAERLYRGKGTLRSFLEDSHDSRDARRRLASEVSGVGPQQASLFLRNIGYAASVAALDIHVLTY